MNKSIDGLISVLDVYPAECALLYPAYDIGMRIAPTIYNDLRTSWTKAIVISYGLEQLCVKVDGRPLAGRIEETIAALLLSFGEKPASGPMLDLWEKHHVDGVDVFGDGLRVMPGVSMGTLWPCAGTEDRKSLEGY